jgi:hypothetical protein
MLRKFAIGLCGLAVLTLLVGAALPRAWHVERRVEIAASSEQIHPFISTPQRWQEWSVWTKSMDAQARHSFSGPSEGAGSERAWLGAKLGRSHWRIVESDPATGVRISAALESDEVNAHSSLTYIRSAAGTVVVWSDEGRLPAILGGYFRSGFENALGENLEASLLKLKHLVEQHPCSTRDPPQPGGPIAPRPQSAPAAGGTECFNASGA